MKHHLIIILISLKIYHFLLVKQLQLLQKTKANGGQEKPKMDGLVIFLRYSFNHLMAVKKLLILYALHFKKLLI